MNTHPRKNTTPLFGALLMTAAMAVMPARAAVIPPARPLPIVLDLKTALPPGLQAQGSNYAIDPEVRNDGFFNIYRLNTPYRDIKVESAAKLRVRVQELNAIAALDAMKKTEVFTTALKESAKAPLKTVKGLVTEPVDTVSNVATGIGNWFSDVGHAIVSDDPNQDNALKTAFGYSAVKRKYAYELDVNPYTAYAPLQDAITDVAQVAFSGGIAPKAAFAAIKRTPGTVLSLTSTADSMKKLVRDNAPARLRDINAETLAKIGVPEDSIKAFLDNYNFDPYEATLLTGALAAMDGVGQRRNMIEAAADADGRDVAMYLRLQAEMMNAYHHAVAKAAAVLLADNRTVLLKKTDGAVVFLAPLDHVESTARLWRRMESLDKAIEAMDGVTGKEIWITGDFSSDVCDALENMGWRVEERVAVKLGGR